MIVILAKKDINVLGYAGDSITVEYSTFTNTMTLGQVIVKEEVHYKHLYIYTYAKDNGKCIGDNISFALVGDDVPDELLTGIHWYDLDSHQSNNFTKTTKYAYIN